MNLQRSGDLCKCDEELESTAYQESGREVKTMYELVETITTVALFVVAGYVIFTRVKKIKEHKDKKEQ